MLTYSRFFTKDILVHFITVVVVLLSSSLVYAQNAQEPWQGAYNSPEFAGGAIRSVYCDLAQEIEGSFGAMVFIVGGIIGFSFAAFGNAKRMYSIVMAGIVGATITTCISLYFGKMCNFGDSSETSRSISKTYVESDSGQGTDQDADNALF